MSVVPLAMTEQAAWEAYQRLVQRAFADVRLFDDPDHVAAMQAAYARFSALFMQAAA